MVRQNTALFLRNHTRTHRLFFLGVLALIFPLFGCNDSKAETAGTEGAGGHPYSIQRVRWFQWLPGGYDEIPSPDDAIPVEQKVWTDQIHGTHPVLLGDDLYIGVNKFGIVKVTMGELTDETPLLRVFTDPAVFSPRTVGNFFYFDGRFYGQMYFNTVFHTTPPPQPVLSLFSLDAGLTDFRIIPFSLQNRDSGWELRTVYPLSAEESWNLVWKKRGKEKTLFRYTRLDFTDWKQNEIDEREFITAASPKDAGSAVPELLRQLVKRLGIGDTAVIDVTLRSPAPKQPEIYRFGDPEKINADDGEYYSLPAFHTGSRCYLLAAGPPRLLYADSTGAGTIELPPLPEGFLYTGLAVSGDRIVLLWEERRFTQTGAAGFTLVEPK